MPLPEPKKNENRDEWDERCMSNDQMKKEFPNKKQRMAVCSSIWDNAKKSHYVKIEKKDKPNQVVKGIVYSPGYIDSDGETMTAEGVRKAAWDFLITRKEKNIDIQHDWAQSGCQVVETYITEKEDPNFPEGSWVMAVKCTDEIWKQVENGELNGFSFGGTVNKYPARALLEVAKEISGTTEANLNKDVIPEHTHQFLIHCDKHGKIIGGKTDHTTDHRHTITYGTATDKALSHSHRIDLNEDN